MSAKEQPAASTLTRDEILAALSALSDELGKPDATGEICLFGGTVMVLAFTARLSTKDVDDIFQPTQIIRDLARRVGESSVVRFTVGRAASRASGRKPARFPCAQSVRERERLVPRLNDSQPPTVNQLRTSLIQIDEAVKGKVEDSLEEHDS